MVVCAFGAYGCNAKKEVQETTVAQTEMTIEAKEVTLQSLVEAVREAYGPDYKANQEYSKEEMNQTFGISEDLYEQAIAFHRLDGVDTFVAIEAKPDKTEMVSAALTEYRNELVSQNNQSAAESLKIAGSSVEKYDKYVFFIVLGKDLAYGELSDAREQTEIGTNTIKRILKK